MNIIETNLKFNSNHSARSGSVKGIVLHHAAANGSVEDVHRWHKNRGWAGIGYHFYVRKDGSVYRGRPETWIGAHTVGHNEKIGICAEGNFDEEKMCAAQKNAIIELLQYLYDKYGKVKVYGHRDLDATACPGRYYPFDSIVNAETETITAVVTAKDYARYFLKPLAGTYKVTASALNIRHGAGVTKKKMVTIPNGTKVECYGYYSTSLGVKWLYIQFTYKGVTYSGFASSKYLKK